MMTGTHRGRRTGPPSPWSSSHACPVGPPHWRHLHRAARPHCPKAEPELQEPRGVVASRPQQRAEPAGRLGALGPGWVLLAALVGLDLQRLPDPRRDDLEILTERPSGVLEVLSAAFADAARRSCPASSSLPCTTKRSAIATAGERNMPIPRRAGNIMASHGSREGLGRSGRSGRSNSRPSNSGAMRGDLEKATEAQSPSGPRPLQPRFSSRRTSTSVSPRLSITAPRTAPARGTCAPPTEIPEVRRAAVHHLPRQDPGAAPGDPRPAASQ